MKRIILFLLTAVLLLAAVGCTAGKDTPNDSTEEGENYDWQILNIRQGESPVEITASGCPLFEGKVDTIDASDIIGGDIVKQVNTCADWGSHYDGSYDIEGEGSRAARYTITPTGSQQHDPIQIGINYFSEILDASFWTADSVEIEYLSDITIKSVIGEFEIFIAAWDENSRWRVETPMTAIKGHLDNLCDVTVSYSKDGYTVSASAPINELTVEGLDGLRNVITTATAETPLSAYTIKSADGQYIIVTE